MSATLQVFQDANFQGRSLTGSLERPHRYFMIENVGDSFNDLISSFRFRVDDPADVYDVYLFEHESFQGKFIRRSAMMGSDVVEPFVGRELNDKISSILIVRRAAQEFALNARDLVPQDFAMKFREFVPERSRRLLRGEPFFSWYPSGSSEAMLFNIKHKGHYQDDVVGVLNTDFEISIRLFLSIDQTINAVIPIIVFAGASWVEESLADQQVRSQIGSAFTDVGFKRKITDEISRSLSGLSSFRSLYLLPGNSSLNTRTGDTANDITLVAVTGDAALDSVNPVLTTGLISLHH